MSESLPADEELHEPVCPPESRCVICWDDDGAVIKALVADRDRLQVVFDEACWEVKMSHGKPCFCKYCWEPSESTPGGGSDTSKPVARGVAAGHEAAYHGDIDGDSDAF